MGRPLDEDIIIKILERWQKAFKENSHYVSASDLSLVIKDVRELPTIQSEKLHGRIFQEIVVEYPSISNPEHKGKPYFSIKYTENEQEFVGYGTYKPEVLSEYLKEYFIPSVQPEPQEGHWIWVAGELMCSECRTIYSDLYPDYDNAVACPHCGAKMKGAQNG